MLVWQCWFGNVGLAMLVWQCWFGNVGLAMLVWQGWFGKVGLARLPKGPTEFGNISRQCLVAMAFFIANASLGRDSVTGVIATYSSS
jgi:hypothetical protein